MSDDKQMDGEEKSVTICLVCLMVLIGFGLSCATEGCRLENETIQARHAEQTELKNFQNEAIVKGVGKFILNDSGEMEFRWKNSD